MLVYRDSICINLANVTDFYFRDRDEKKHHFSAAIVFSFNLKENYSQLECVLNFNSLKDAIIAWNLIIRYYPLHSTCCLDDFRIDENRLN